MNLDSMYLDISASHIRVVKLPVWSWDAKKENPERLERIGTLWTSRCSCSRPRRALILQMIPTNPNLISFGRSIQWFCLSGG